MAIGLDVNCTECNSTMYLLDSCYCDDCIEAMIDKIVALEAKLAELTKNE